MKETLVATMRYFAILVYIAAALLALKLLVARLEKKKRRKDGAECCDSPPAQGCDDSAATQVPADLRPDR